MPMGRVALRLALPALLLCGTAACVPPPALSISGGAARGPGSYAIVDGDAYGPAVQGALAKALAERGLRPADGGGRPDWLVSLSFADRPVASGAFTGTDVPATADAPGWIDRPHKTGPLSRGRREVRLAIRFLDAHGKQHEALEAAQVVTRNAPAADAAALIAAAFASAR